MRERRVTRLDSQSSSTTYSPKQYWSNVAQAASSADEDGFGPVLHPGAPAWFNREIDKLQYRAMRRALRIANVAPGACVLDVGCGTGRWLRRFQRLGFRATGVDATSLMLAIARAHGTVVPLVTGEANRLPFADAQFDCVSDVTVIQHMPLSVQSAALGEMMRVLKPNGRLILVELIRGLGAHIFPHSPQQWIEKATGAGAVMVEWFGQEYLVFDRVFVRAAQAMNPTSRDPNRATLLTVPSYSHSPTVARRAYWAVRYVTTRISSWIEPIAERTFPPDRATHGVFVFRKP